MTAASALAMAADALAEALMSGGISDLSAADNEHEDQSPRRRRPVVGSRRCLDAGVGRHPRPAVVVRALGRAGTRRRRRANTWRSDVPGRIWGPCQGAVREEGPDVRGDAGPAPVHGWADARVLHDLLTAGNFAGALLDIDPADVPEALEHLGLDHMDAEGTMAAMMATAVEVGVRQLPANVLADGARGLHAATVAAAGRHGE